MKFSVGVFTLLILTFSNFTMADWFTSSETKELITKADAGDIDAQFRVGVAYDYGNGAPKSVEKAKKYYLMAANQGMSEAQNSLGSIFLSEKNYSEAKIWYEKAADKNHPMATNSLGYMYDLGLGIPQDRNKGFELYTRAADLGWAESMWSIAVMYGAGQIGTPDLFKACVWAVRAEKHAKNQSSKLNQILEHALPRIQNDLSGKDWGRCHEEANTWSPKLVNALEISP